MSNPESSFGSKIEFVATSTLEQALGVDGQILRVNHFTDIPTLTTLFEPIAHELTMPALTDSSYEVCYVDVEDVQDVVVDKIGPVKVARLGDVALLSMSMSNYADYAASDLAVASYEAYGLLFRTVRQQKLGQFLRVWNYIPHILEELNVVEIDRDDRELYRQFNAGRYDAWQQFGDCDANNYPICPAASGVGCLGGPLIVEALVSQSPVQYVENPRQIPAYHYPREYGTKPPYFSRGTLRSDKNGSDFYISGTASIIGSKTVHTNNLDAQIDETFHNIEVLIGAANLKKYEHPGFTLEDISYLRVYVKRAVDFQKIREQISSILGDEIPVIYANNAICRPDLLLEIEGFARKIL